MKRYRYILAKEEQRKYFTSMFGSGESLMREVVG